MRPLLCPVVRPTPGQDRSLPIKLRIENQRLAAREACLASAKRLGLALAELPQAKSGAPLPIDGWHWSISHTTGFSCGVVYPGPVGIDVEPVKQRRQDTIQTACDRAEFDLVGGFSWSNFTRIWTAKEAVLKQAGCGLSELSGCRIVAAPTQRAMIVHHREAHLFVFQRYKFGHWASISASSTGAAEVRWDWSEQEPSAEARVGGFSL
ncbi:MAG: 4'-phosphopantetheinyl transferase superfamily protein [bacterium]|jgi:4'-phosphopantetheinyl transferase